MRYNWEREPWPWERHAKSFIAMGIVVAVGSALLWPVI